MSDRDDIFGESQTDERSGRHAETRSDEWSREDERRGPRGRGRGEPRLRELARRIFRDPDGERDSGEREPRERTVRVDPRELLGAILETGDKAKTEAVRMVAREVRSYLDALELGKDLHHLLTNYSLEIHASFSLKPLSAEASAPREGRAKQREGEEAEPDGE